MNSTVKEFDDKSDKLHLSKKYRKAISNPLMKQKTTNLDNIYLDYQHSNYAHSKIANVPICCPKSLPVQFMYGSKNSELSLSFIARDNSLFQKPASKHILSKEDERNSNLFKEESKIQKKKVKRFSMPTPSKSIYLKKASILSVATPSLANTFSDASFDEPELPIRKTPQSPLYTLLGKAMSDISDILAHHVLKRDHNPWYPKSARKRSTIIKDDLDLKNPTEIVRPSRTFEGIEEVDEESENVFENKNLREKPSRLKSIPKCNQGYQCSFPESSLYVNPSTAVSDESILNQLTIQQVQNYSKEEKKYHTTLKIIERLNKECQADKSFKRIMHKGATKYRIDFKDYPVERYRLIKTHRTNVMGLTGSQTLMINKRSTMIKLYRLNLFNYNKRIDSKKNQLYVNEEKRLRKLQNQGIVKKNFDELQTKSHIQQSYEKPHIAYNSNQPIFNENPNAHLYKILTKNKHREYFSSRKHDGSLDNIDDITFYSDSARKKLNLDEKHEITDEIENSTEPHTQPLYMSAKANVTLFVQKNKHKIITINKQEAMDNIFNLASSIFNEKTNTFSLDHQEFSLDTSKMVSTVSDSHPENK